MQFMMLMIPNVYRGNKKLDPGFVPDPEKIAEMARFNEELGKAVKILSLNGLHPLSTGARVSFGKGKPMVTAGRHAVRLGTHSRGLRRWLRLRRRGVHPLRGVLSAASGPRRRGHDGAGRAIADDRAALLDLHDAREHLGG